MNTEPIILSPRLQKLQQALDAAEAGALDHFWNEMQASGTPLFEPIPDQDAQVYCTFLYRATDHENVLAVPSFLELTLEKARMTRLGASDVWYLTAPTAPDIMTTYRIAPDDSLQSLQTLTSMKQLAERTAHWVSDPLNVKTYSIPTDEQGNEDELIEVSVLAGPAYKPHEYVTAHPHVTARVGTAAGTLSTHTFSSQILNNERRLHIYTPPGYSAAGERYHLLLLFDGIAYAQLMKTPIMLDNLLADGLIAPTVAVMVDNALESRDHELPPNELMPEFLRKELLPWVREHYHVSADPAQVTIAGLSYGGLAAAWNAFKAPDLFGNVLSQSGSYWWAPAIGKPTPDGEPGWLIRQYIHSERLPLYFYLDVGLLENHDFFGGASHRGLNRHMRDVLRAKGYPVSYAEYSGGHEFVWWQQTVADGLIALRRMRQGT